MSEKDRYKSKQVDISRLLGESETETNSLDVNSLIGNREKKDERIRSLDPPKGTVHSTPNVYFAAIIMVLAAIYLILKSFFPLLYNFTISFDIMDFLINSFYLILGIGTLWGAVYLLKRESSMHHVADDIFDSVIFKRLEPVLEDVAGVQADLEYVENKLDMLNININRLENKREATNLGYGGGAVDQSSLVKYFILINMTLALFLFMIQFPFSYTPYAITVMFIIWWIFITIEYKIWNNETSWVWAFIPTLTLPVLTILLSGYLLNYELIGMAFSLLVVYVFAYYSWCSYLVKGILPFGLEIALKDLSQKVKTENKIKQIEETHNKIEFSKLITFNTGIAFILFSVLIFGVSLFGYAIQNSLVTDLSWQSLGLYGFAWSSIYSYTLQILGFIMLVIGYGITTKSKKQ